MDEQQFTATRAKLSQSHWVFGYGSLMWDPGFDYHERVPALLHGWHRVFSLLSTKAWGSVSKPGMVLALHPGGACRGTAMRVAVENWSKVDSYLRDREVAYRHVDVKIRTADGVTMARTFVADPRHPRFVGKLPVNDAAKLISQGRGGKGTSFDYLTGTIRSLETIGSKPGKYLLELLDEAEQLRRR